MPRRTVSAVPGLAKCPTGIAGLDEITTGGLPKGRPTLICGGPGCGKTLFGIEFLVRGVQDFGEPGVFVAFEERPEELADNVVSLGFDLRRLEKQKKLFIEHIHVDRHEIEETGEYDLEALFLRLGDAIDTVGAKRVVLDTLETLFAFPNEAILRSELRRLFRWLKDRGVTAVITAERGDGRLTRHGLEEYVSDCVIFLDHRVQEQVATRRLRVVKYRGTSHGTNEYPFLINEDGVDVLPITSVGLAHDAPTERISSGIADLDVLMGGGMYRGSSVLISGTAGSGKSSVAAHAARAACERGERALIFAYEESPQQIVRNMRSIGVDLRPYIESGRLRISSSRPTSFGTEMHLATIHKMVRDFEPHVVAVDPITNFFTIADTNEVKAMLTRLVDFLKVKKITGIFTSLTSGGKAIEATEAGVSSIVDTWLLLRDLECNGERNRTMYVLKSRGTAHSNQVREFIMSSKGIRLAEPYLGVEGVLTGSARLAQEAKDAAVTILQRDEISRKRRAIERHRQALQAQIVAIRDEIEAEADELERLGHQETLRVRRAEADHAAMAASRKSARSRVPPAASRRLNVKGQGVRNG